MSAGIVSALRNDDTGRLVAIQTSAAISRGSSGGGLFTSGAGCWGSPQRPSPAAPRTSISRCRWRWCCELPERHAAAHCEERRRRRAANERCRCARRIRPAARGTRPVEPAAAPAPDALAGQWSGDFRCGPYLLQAKVPNPNGWSIPANMTVGSDGRATIVRGDTLYAESVSGDVQADGTATLRGRGANKTNAANTWTTEVTGRFAGTGRDARFDGQANIRSASGEISRRCTVRLTKNTIG